MRETLLRVNDRGTVRPEVELKADTVDISVRLCNLPPLNAVANQVLALSADPDVSVAKLASAMECDPAFAVDVLFLANSSLFGFPSRVQTMRHAIALLGLERIKALAVTAAMRGFIERGGPLLRLCWQHSAACALIAEQIGPAFAITREVAYMVGLIHDIGRLGLLKSDATNYSALLRSSFDCVDSVLHAERKLVGVDHCNAGAWLAKHWCFPNVFMQTTEAHHGPLSPHDAELLQVTKVSCQLADAMGYSAIHYNKTPGVDELLQSLPSFVPRAAFPSTSELTRNVETRFKGFE